MKILALDTTIEACSVALYTDEELIERFEVAPRKHIELLSQMVRSIMIDAEIELSDLTGLAFGAGPGSFAGLRVACAYTQGLASALNIPIVPVSSLLALAYPFIKKYPDCIIFSALDAKMDSLYINAYEYVNQQPCVIIPDQAISRSDPFPFTDAFDKPVILVGHGWDLVPEWVQQLNPKEIQYEIYPRAGEIAMLSLYDFNHGLGLKPEEVSPFYIRHNIALTLAEQQALKHGK